MAVVLTVFCFLAFPNFSYASTVKTWVLSSGTVSLDSSGAITTTIGTTASACYNDNTLVGPYCFGTSTPVPPQDSLEHIVANQYGIGTTVTLNICFSEIGTGGLSCTGGSYSSTRPIYNDNYQTIVTGSPVFYIDTSSPYLVTATGLSGSDSATLIFDSGSSCGSSTTLLSNMTTYGLVSPYPSISSTCGTSYTFHIEVIQGGNSYITPEYSYNSGIVTTVSALTDGIISQITPTPAESDIGSLVHFSGTYNVLTSSTFDKIVLELTNTTDSTTVTLDNIDLLYTFGVDLPYSFNYPVILNRSYSYRLRLKDSSTSTYTAWTTPALFSTTNIPTSPIIDINSINTNSCNSGPVIISILGADIDFSGFVNASCKTVTFLFFPSQDSLTSFSTLTGMIENKPPFAYFIQIKNALNFSSTTAPTFTVATMTPLMDLIFTPLRTALIWILWLGFAFYLYKRSKHIEL